MNTNITYQNVFECGYISSKSNSGVSKFDLNCHRYQIIVTIKSLDIHVTDGRILDFESLKSIVDHLLPRNTWLYSDEDVDDVFRYGIVKSMEGLNISTAYCDFIICCENLAKKFAVELQKYFDDHYDSLIKVAEVKLKETTQVYATVAAN